MCPLFVILYPLFVNLCLLFFANLDIKMSPSALFVILDAWICVDVTTPQSTLLTESDDETNMMMKFEGQLQKVSK